LHYTRRSLAVSGTDRNPTGFNATDNHDFLALAEMDFPRIFYRRPQYGLLRTGNQANSRPFPAAFRFQIARFPGTAGEAHRVEILQENTGLMIFPDRCLCLEDYSFLFPYGYPAVEHVFFQLEIRDPVAQQPSDTVVALEHGDLMPGLVQLIRAR
jgi:hypothetical protein